MVKCGVFFAVRTEFLYIIQTNFGFKGSTCQWNLATQLPPALLAFNYWWRVRAIFHKLQKRQQRCDPYRGFWILGHVRQVPVQLKVCSSLSFERLQLSAPYVISLGPSGFQICWKNTHSCLLCTICRRFVLFVVYLTTLFQYLRLYSVDFYSIVIRLPSSSEAGESRVRNMAEFCRRASVVLVGFFYMP
jgi:hypothetical protein